MPVITVVGSTNTDLVVKTPRLPMVGETVKGTAFQIFSGGKGANQAVAASRLGASVNFITKIGRDNFGQRELDNLKSHGINTDHVIVDNQHPSGVALIEVDFQGNNRIVVAPGANDYLSIEDIQPIKQVIENSDVVLVQLEIPIDTVGYVLEIGARANTTVILNPAPAEKLPAAFFPNISIMTPNETEAAFLTGLDSSRNDLVAESLLAKGVKTVVITLGAKGIYFKSGNDEGEIAGFKVNVIDTTAAGDAFSAGLAVSIAEGASLRNAIMFANAAAALAVTKMGAQPSLPDRIHVQKLLDTLK
jgi:ribokinase